MPRGQGSGESPYLLGDVYCDRYELGSDEDQLRWHLTNFWYTVATLRDQESIDDELIQARFGSSLDVIRVLEPIEAVLSYRLWYKDKTVVPSRWEAPEWPVWNLYARYRGKPESKTVPADKDALKRWRDGFEQRQQGQAS